MLRAREPQLLSGEKAQRMLDAPSFEEAAKLLTDCGYPDMAACKADEIEAILAKRRDAVLAEARALLAGADSADAAWETVNAALPSLAAAAKDGARAAGYPGPVRCMTGVFDFPERQYGGVTVPAGRYRALRVVIGAGEGHNWWCVLYPSLCDPAALEDAPCYSILWEWLRGLFGGEAS